MPPRLKAMRDPALLRAFAARNWDAVARSKAAMWQELTPADKIRLADELRRQALLTRPGWPSAADRRADLQTHLRVSEALRRVPPRLR
jgi:hypothetical protein